MRPTPPALSRRNFLLGSAVAAALAPRSLAAQAGSHPEFLVVCLADGGWDPLYAFDPKPGNNTVTAPFDAGRAENPGAEYTRTFGHNQLIQCNDLERAPVTRFFEDWGHRTAVLNGMWMGSIVHEPCRIRLLTGTTQASNPDWPTIFGARMGGDAPLGSIDFSGLGYPGTLAGTTGRVGVRSQLKALLDPASVYPAPTWADYALPLYTPTESEQDAVRTVLEQRAAAFRERMSDAGGHNDRRIDDLLTSLDRRERLIDSGVEIVGELDLAAIPTFEQQVGTAAGLLDNGLCRAVTLKLDADWDTHTGNHPGQSSNFSAFFRSISNLLGELETRGLLDRTLVVVGSEMGRTPRENVNFGKDHWTHSSQLLIGAGVRGGLTLGGTDDSLESLKMDLATGDPTGAAQDGNAPGELCKYDNFAAGVLAHMGIDPGEFYPSVTPFTGFSELG